MSENGWAKLGSKLKIALAVSPGGLRRYFHNISWLLVGQAVSLGVSFFVSAWIVRSLGPNDFGIFSFSLSFAGLFSLLAGLGIDGVLARDLVGRPENQGCLLGTGLAIKAVTGLIAWLGATASAFILLPPGSGRLVVSLIALAYFFHCLNIIDILFRARIQSRFSAQAQMLAVVTAALLKIWVVLSGAGLVWLAAAYSAEILVSGLILVVSYWRQAESFAAWRFDRQTAWYLLSSSWPLLFSGLAAFFLLRIDQIMIRYYLSPTAVGWYAAGVKLTEVWYFLPGIIGAALFPAVINSRQTDERVYRRRLSYFYWLLGVIALFLALGLTLAMPVVIAWLFGEQFRPAVWPAIIYAWSLVGWFLSSAWWLKLMAENRLRLIFYSSLAPLVINVLLNIYLIPRYGLTGAAAATLISYSSIIILIIYCHAYENSTCRH